MVNNYMLSFMIGNTQNYVIRSSILLDKLLLWVRFMFDKYCASKSIECIEWHLKIT